MEKMFPTFNKKTINGSSGLGKSYLPEVKGYVIYFPLVRCPRGINQITTSFRLITSLFLHWRGFLKGCKNTLKKNASVVHLSFVFQHSMLALVGFTSFLAF